MSGFVNESQVKKFWEYIEHQEFDKLTEVMLNTCQVWLPNTREVFETADKYIEFNKKYPGAWNTEIEKITSVGDLVITAVKVTEPTEDVSLYVTSFFEFKDGFINNITEYWGDNEKPPVWRVESGLSQTY